MSTKQFIKESADIPNNFAIFLDKPAPKLHSVVTKSEQPISLQGLEIKDQPEETNLVTQIHHSQEHHGRCDTSRNPNNSQQSKICSHENRVAYSNNRYSKDHSASFASQKSSISAQNAKNHTTKMRAISWDQEKPEESIGGQNVNDKGRFAQRSSTVQNIHLQSACVSWSPGRPQQNSSSDDSIDERIIKIRAKMRSSLPPANNTYRAITWDSIKTAQNKAENMDLEDTTEKSSSIECPNRVPEESVDLDDLMDKIVLFHAKHNSKHHRAKNELNSSIANFSRVCILQSTNIKHYNLGINYQSFFDEKAILNERIGQTEQDDLAPLGSYEEFEAQLLCRLNCGVLIPRANKTL